MNETINCSTLLYIYYDSGLCIYKSIEDNKVIDKSLEGIIQALHNTAQDFSASLKLVSTECGVLSYQQQTYNETSILIVLMLPNNFADSESSEFISQRILDLIYTACVIHIGTADLFGYNSPREVEKIRKMLKIYDNTFKYIIHNYKELDLLAVSEEKIEIKKEVFYPIKHFMEELMEKQNLSVLTLKFGSSLVWFSKDYLLIDPKDRIIISIITRLYIGDDVYTIPLYLANKDIQDDIGKVTI